MIKNYIFDFGNVLAEFYPHRLTAPFVEDEAEREIIAEVVFDRLYWDKLDDGSITDDEVREGIRSRLQGERGEVGCRVYDNWIESLTPVPGMEKLVEDIRKSGEGIYLLSNISTGFAENYQNTQWINKLFSNFDGLVFSGVAELVKPNREIFEHILGRFGLVAEECLFIDDNVANIEGAKAVGIQTYLFDGDAEKLRAFLGF